MANAKEDWMPVNEFHLRERIESMSKNSIVLKGNNGEKIYCHRYVFNALMAGRGTMIRVVVLPAHAHCHVDTLWIEALLPMRVFPTCSF